MYVRVRLSYVARKVLQLLSKVDKTSFHWRLSLFWSVTRRMLVVGTDVSGRRIGAIRKSQAVREEFLLGCLNLEDGTGLNSVAAEA